MIPRYKNVIGSSIDFLKKEVISTGLEGYLSFTVLEMFFNLYSWLYFEDIKKVPINNKKTRKFLLSLPLESFKGDSVSYSAVLLYKVLKDVINLRKFESGEIERYVDGDNRFLAKKGFVTEELFNLYSSCEMDISTEFLLFNSLFSASNIKKISTIKKYSDIVNVSRVTDLVRPDFGYKVGTRKLLVDEAEKVEDVGDSFIYVLQDCTKSMSFYADKLKLLKSLILNDAFKKGFEVRWLFITDEIKKEVVYSKSKHYSPIIYYSDDTKINLSNILNTDRFSNKKVVVITDGTDTFKFKFITRTNKINFVSLTPNINLKNKLSKYGRFFNAF